jgi:hypothetical protein
LILLILASSELTLSCSAFAQTLAVFHSSGKEIQHMNIQKLIREII